MHSGPETLGRIRVRLLHPYCVHILSFSNTSLLWLVATTYSCCTTAAPALRSCIIPHLATALGQKKIEEFYYVELKRYHWMLLVLRAYYIQILLDCCMEIESGLRLLQQLKKKKKNSWAWAAPLIDEYILIFVYSFTFPLQSISSSATCQDV